MRRRGEAQGTAYTEYLRKEQAWSAQRAKGRMRRVAEGRNWEPQIQSIGGQAKDFGLFPNVTGKPWKHFKWENSMVIFRTITLAALRRTDWKGDETGSRQSN